MSIKQQFMSMLMAIGRLPATCPDCSLELLKLIPPASPMSWNLVTDSESPISAHATSSTAILQLIQTTLTELKHVADRKKNHVPELMALPSSAPVISSSAFLRLLVNR